MLKPLNSNYGPSSVTLKKGSWIKTPVAKEKRATPALNINFFDSSWCPIFKPPSWDKSSIRNRIKATVDFFSSLKNFQQKQEFALSQFLNKNLPLAESNLDYSKYFQWPGNRKVQKLVDDLIDPSWSDDKKVYVIEQWIIKNIEYVEDIKQYRQNEYWALPTETLASRKGDCEDGAILFMSMALHAGVDPKKLFFYGGTARPDGGLQLFGHGWGGYKRSSDDQMVAIDWCYYPTSKSLDERLALKDNQRYYDDFFVATVFKTVETEYANWVRNPEDIKAVKLAIKNYTDSIRALNSSNIIEANQRSLSAVARINNNFRTNISATKDFALRSYWQQQDLFF